jgi:protein involved in polysaccharide export with SLBB domain
MLVLFVGISIGYALNLQTFKLLTGPANEARMRSLPMYRVMPPDLLQIEVTADSNVSPLVSGKQLIGPDGNINLGTYGSLYVAGKTIRQVQDAIRDVFAKHVASPSVVVDVAGYNSHFYYVINQRGTGNYLMRFPITGNETALDAIAQIGGLTAPDTTDVWISRPNRRGTDAKLVIDWDEIARGASTTTNYQLMPGDRVFVAQKVPSQ